MSLPTHAPNKDSLLSPCLEGQGAYAREAHASARSMWQCMAMGQAAGLAAAPAVAAGQTPRQLAVQELKARLLSEGVLFSGARV
jgi:hypothetical protein